ncbi:MAG: RraA family protein [Solobacterium sp.]|nr:RraA family protein [Solobacterium sp.]
MSLGYTIHKDIHRVSKELIEQFRPYSIANLDDCLHRTAAISSAIQPLNKVRLQGVAYTVKVPAGDNLLFYYAIDNAKPGDVIVVDGDGYTERALCGEIMATLAKKRGLAGFVIHGAIRDKEELEKMDFPVFAIASSPNGPYKNGPGEINVPVNIGGRIISPGDILIGNQEGLISFKEEEANQLLEDVQKVIAKESKMLESIEKNRSINLDWMYEELKKAGVI